MSLSELSHTNVDKVLDAYNSCKRFALIAISEKRLTRYEWTKRYRDEIFHTFNYRTYTEILETIENIKCQIKSKNHLKK